MAGDNPGVLANAAFALAYFGEDIGAVRALADRALALNPSFARGWHISGTIRLYAGQPDIAIEHLEASLRLSPRARVGPTLATIGAAHLVSRRFDQAVPKYFSRSKRIQVIRKLIEHLPPATPIWVGLTTHGS